MNSKAGQLKRTGTNSVVGMILPLKGYFAVPRGPSSGLLLMNKNMNATPVLCLNRRLTGGNYGPAFLLNTEDSGSLLRLRRFTTCNRICAAARSNDRKRGKCMARRSVLGGIYFRRVCAYNPGPVVVTMTGCTGDGNVDYRMSLRGVVTYNVNTYLYYMRGAARNRLYMYGRNPIFGVGGLL